MKTNKKKVKQRKNMSTTPIPQKAKGALLLTY